MLVWPSICCSLFALREPEMCGVEAPPTLLTDGVNVARSKGFLPFSGRSTMRLSVITAPVAEVLVSRFAEVSETMTDSFWPPTESEKLTGWASETSTVTLSCRSGRKPAAATCTL